MKRLSFELSPEEGAFLVKLAREAVTEYLKSGKVIPVPSDMSKKLLTRAGVFVTLNSVTSGRHELRGCIGFPTPTHPLAQAVIESSIESATNDPRFPQVTLEELKNIVVELSVLTPPRLIEAQNPSEHPKHIKVGQDGLIVERGFMKGLLLPQVPVEWGWDEEEFLCQCCVKAGLSPEMWCVKGTKVYKFQAIIFEETSPGGRVVRKEI